MGTNQRRVEVAIVGGGLAGLSAGVALGQAGVAVELFERSTNLGGRAASRLVGDYVLDLGPHALYAAGSARRGLESLGVTVRGRTPEPRAAAKIGERYFQLPMGAPSLLGTGLLGFADKLRLARLLTELQSPKCAARLAALDPNSTVSQWIAERLPPGRGRLLMETMVRLSTYSGHPQQRARLALNQLRLAVTDGVLYLDGGWRSLVDALEQALPASARIRRGCKVSGLRYLDDASASGWELSLADGRTVRADQVILAVAPGVARKLLASGAENSGAARAYSRIPQAPASYAACLQVALDPAAPGKYDFILGIDQPHYLSVFSAAASVGPSGSEVIHAMRYLDQSEPTPETRSELEGLLDAARPGWRGRVCEASYQPRLCVTNWVETPGLPRPDCELGPSLFAAGDWLNAGGVLADAAVESALEASRRVLKQRASLQARPAPMCAPPVETSELWS